MFRDRNPYLNQKRNINIQSTCSDKVNLSHLLRRNNEKNSVDYTHYKKLI